MNAADVVTWIRHRWLLAVGAVLGDLPAVLVWHLPLPTLVASPIIVFVVMSFVFWLLDEFLDEHERFQQEEETERERYLDQFDLPPLSDPDSMGLPLSQTVGGYVTEEP